MIIAGLAMLIAGWLLSFCQVMQIIPLNLYVSFLAQILSFVGLLVGVVGIVQWRGRQT